ncbi:MAG: F0F1 ATP synthase subunit delta [Bacillota bacterium]
MAQLIAKTYAKALFDVALELKQIEQFGKELDGVIETFNQYPEFYELYKTPQINNDEKKKIMEEVFGKSMSQEVMNLFKILLDKGRASIVEYMTKEYHNLANEHNNMVEAVAVTTVPLKDEDRSRLTEKLSAMTGKKIVLKNEIDKTIIGGILVRIGDKVIDGTIQRRLKELEENLAQIIV